MSFLPDSGQILVYDTEFTSWKGFRENGFREPGRYPEIIQFGAVKLDMSDGLRETAAFECFVRPRENPELSDYIVDLTGITQAVIDEHGRSFEAAFEDFQRFTGGDCRAYFSYGEDHWIVSLNCGLNDVVAPEWLKDERNLRDILAERGLVDPRLASSDLPAAFGLDADFKQHDALGDARAIAMTLRHLLQEGRIR